MRRNVPIWAVRLAIVGALALLLVVVAGGVFDRVPIGLFPVPVLVVAATAALRGRARRWRAAGALGAVAAGILTAVLAADGTPAGAVTGVVDGPRQLLTTEWPSPLVPTLAATIAALVGVVTAVAAELAARDRWHLAPLVPVGAGFVILLALGAPVRPAAWVVAGLVVLAAALALLPGTDSLRHRVGILSGDRTLAVTAAAIAVTAIAVSIVVAFSDRADPRRVEPADLTAAVLDPIEASAALRAADPTIQLFEITDRSAVATPAMPSRWRVAALDEYDGQRWVPEVTLRPIGERLGQTDDAAGELTFRYELTFRTDDIDLVPFPGRPLAVDAPVETDTERVAVRLLGGVTADTTVHVESEIAPSAATAATSQLPIRPVDEIADSFTEAARELGGESTVIIEQLRTIEDTMREDWVLDAQAPGGGQQLALIERFVTDTNRGTREQFVTAFVLLARSIGVDARVATGFEVPADDLVSPLVIESDHAAAWPEVRLADGDWMAFDPVPTAEKPPDEEPTDPPEAQSPAAAQPPSQPPAEEGDDEEETTVVADTAESRWGAVVAIVARVGAVTALAVSPLLLVVAVILALKWQRRRRRLRDPDPARRVRGAWANATDALVDAGLTIAPSWTDDRIAVGAAELAPTAPHELRRLAAMSTAVTFGPRQHADRIVDDAAATSRLVESALRADRTRWQRIRWRLSLRSFRPSTRSPIVV